MRAKLAFAVALSILGITLAVTPALAQKQGGTLRIYHRDNLPSGSIHEEATISTVQPFMAVFNNLVMFDQAKKLNSTETIVPDLAESWAWDATKTKLTFKLRQGVKWHDGKPFTAKDVQCTWNKLTGKDTADDFRRNPRAIWCQNLKEVTVNGDHEATFVLGRPQPSLLNMFASGYTPVYPCHVSTKDMRTNPDRHRALQVRRVQARRRGQVRAQSRLLEEGPALRRRHRVEGDREPLDAHPGLRRRRVRHDVLGRRVTVPLLKDVTAQAPKAICELAPTYVSTNLIINPTAAPFNDAKVRKAMALALDRKAIIDILSQGKHALSGVMLPPPEGQWGMPPDDAARSCRAMRPTSRRAAPRRARSWRASATASSKPLKVKVSTRNIAIYRDPAVILIDQLKNIHIDGELEVVDTSIWHAKVTRKEYSVGLNLTGVGVDDPDVNLYENYSLQLGAQPHAVLQQGGRRADRQAVAGTRRRQAQADRLGDREAAGRGPGAPDHLLRARRDLLAAAREGFRAAPQQHLQQLALRGRVAGQVAHTRRAAGLAEINRRAARGSLSRTPLPADAADAVWHVGADLRHAAPGAGQHHRHHLRLAPGS